MPSPPPRKVKPTAWLKEIHAKQLGSLQQREQQLLDIIEDVRSFAKQRADIERLYGQSLLKISSQLLAKKELFNVPGEEKAAADGNEHKSVQSAWKCCLEETEKLGSSRMKAADVYNQTVSERCKVLKSHKQLAIRKALEQLNSLQADLTQSVKEFGVEHKQYTDDEVIAYEARNKANTAGQRLANKETGVFSSVNTLKKSQAKTFAKMEEANAQSASSRNGYLLQLTAVNAHTGRMHSKHIPSLFKSLDDGVYDELSSCISVIGQTEINTCNTVLSTHDNITSTCALVTPQFNLDCFLQVNPVFSEQITFAFEPVQNDTVSGLSIDYGEDQRLEKETRNWARKVARETRTLADLHDQINQVTNKGVPGDSVLEVELSKLHACVRRSEVAKLKAEARLDLLRTVNMPVDEMLTQATSEHESLPDNQSFTSRGSTHSGDTFDSFSDHQSEPPSLRPAHLPRVQEDTVSASRVSIQSSVIAIYDYKASQPDELTLTEGEVLSIIDHGTGDGWLRASNSSGVLGLVPENYIETYEQVLSPTDTVTGYMTDNATPESQSNISHQPGSLGYVRALYDYQADGLDELSFSAGQVITLLSRDENGIDDGYWKGEIEGVQGMFPSLVVEEIENLWSSGETTNTQEQAWHAEAAEQHWAEENTAVQEPVKQASAPHSFSGSYESDHQMSHSESTGIPLSSHYRDAPQPPAEKGIQSENRELYASHPSPVLRDSVNGFFEADSRFPESFQPEPINEELAQHIHSQSQPVLEEPAREATQESNIHIEPQHWEPPHMEPQHIDPPCMEPPCMEPPHMEPPHMEPPHMEPPHMEPPHMEPPHRPQPYSQSQSLTPPACQPRLPSRSKSQPQSQLQHDQSLEIEPKSDLNDLDVRRHPKPNVDFNRKPNVDDDGQAGVNFDEKPIVDISAKSNANYNRKPGVDYDRKPSVDYSSKPVAGRRISYSNNKSDAPSDITSADLRPGPVRRPPPAPPIIETPAVPQFGPTYSHATSSAAADLRFRQMQPLPHKYYMEQSYPGDPAGPKDRSSSARSFGSLSSSDSREEKHTPIRMARQPTTDSPAQSPVGPGMSVKDAVRLLPQGLVNPSYRVATMLSDPEPPSSQRRNSGLARPTATPRRGGLPGHVREGIVQGRKMLSEAANDSPAVTGAQPMKRQAQKSETAV